MALRREIAAIALALRHPDTPLMAKFLAGAVVAYALSPIDLVPDFIPVLGQLDDLLLLPLGITLVVRLLPEPVLSDCRARAESGQAAGRLGLVGAVIIALLWVFLIVVAIRAVQH